MSYNVTAFNIKEITGLHIRIEDVPYHMDIEHVASGDDATYDLIGCGESQRIEGVCADGFIHVADIKFRGEFSGSLWGWFIEFLGETKGKLNAVVVWEGGDTIERLIVNDGVVTEESLE